MKETSFIDQNKKKWARFEKMSQSNQGDPDEMSQLFVEITDDLAFARTYYPKRSVRVYLNSLAQKVFHNLYKRRKEPLSKFFNFWTTGLPLEMYRSRVTVLVAFLVFAIGMLIGIVSTLADENFLGAVIGYDYVAMAENNIAEGKPMNVYGSGSEIDSFLGIAINNLRVCLLTFVLGIFFALGSAIFLFFNAIMVGAFQWFYVVRGLTLASFLTIWIHGAFEIPSIILAGAAGMTLGLSFMFPGTLSRMQALVKGAKRGVKMMIGIFPFIILAAFIEGYATRHTVITLEGDPIPSEWPTELKWIFILSCFALFIWYFVIYPFYVAKKHNYTGKEVEPVQFRESKILDLFKIKDVGELFTDTFIAFKNCFSLFFKLFVFTIPLNALYLYLLLQNHPYDYLMAIEDLGGRFDLPFILRVEKMMENISLLFVWDNYFSLGLFLFQVFLFSLNAANIIYAFKVIVEKSFVKSFKNYFSFIGLYLLKIIPVYLILGLIACFAPGGLIFLLISLVPLFFMFDKPLAFGKKSFSSRFNDAWGIGFKAYGNALGLFSGLFVTLFIIYVFVGYPLEFMKDFVMDWFVLPLAKDPKIWLIFGDAIFYLLLAHFIFPMFHIAFSFLYFSTVEKLEGVSLFEKLKSFGTKSKTYEATLSENEIN